MFLIISTTNNESFVVSFLTPIQHWVQHWGMEWLGVQGQRQEGDLATEGKHGQRQWPWGRGGSSGTGLFLRDCTIQREHDTHSALSSPWPACPLQWAHGLGKNAWGRFVGNTCPGCPSGNKLGCGGPYCQPAPLAVMWNNFWKAPRSPLSLSITLAWVLKGGVIIF